MKLITLTAALFVAFAGTSYAVDGVIEINQARALAGVVTPGDTPGFPVTISQPGSYRLTGSLAVPAGTDGISVTADNVTIDLNGFAITGGYDGINGEGKFNLVVANGSILGVNKAGIVLGYRSRVERVQLEGVGSPIGVGIDGSGARDVLVSGCVISNFHSHGISVASGLVTGNVVQTTGVPSPSEAVWLPVTP